MRFTCVRSVKRRELVEEGRKRREGKRYLILVDLEFLLLKLGLSWKSSCGVLVDGE